MLKNVNECISPVMTLSLHAGMGGRWFSVVEQERDLGVVVDSTIKLFCRYIVDRYF